MHRCGFSSKNCQTLVVGSGCGEKIERLLRADPAGLSRDQLFDCLEQLTAVEARVQGKREQVLAAIHDPCDSKEWAREEVACALRWSPDHAKTRLVQATHLTTKLPRLFALHEAGRISDAHVRVAANLTHHLDAKVIAQVEACVLERAPEQTVIQFRASLRRVIGRLDARKAEERHAEAKNERLVHCVPLPDGMAGIWSTHTAADAEAMFAQLTEAAKKADTAADGRSMDQRRTDTLRDLVLGRTKAGTPARGMRVQVLVRQDTADGSSDLPGELAGTARSRQARSARSWPTSPPASTEFWLTQRAGSFPSAASTIIPNAASHPRRSGGG